MLLEDAGEADDPRSQLEHTVRAAVDVGGGGVASREQAADLPGRRRPGVVPAQP
jgi:hypothetical protein